MFVDPVGGAASHLFCGGDTVETRRGGSSAAKPETKNLTYAVETGGSCRTLENCTIAGPLIDPLPDVRGGSAYKTRLGLVAVEEAVRASWKERDDERRIPFLGRRRRR